MKNSGAREVSFSLHRIPSPPLTVRLENALPDLKRKHSREAPSV